MTRTDDPISSSTRLERLVRSRLLGHGLFWSWNALFVLYAGFGLLPAFVLPLLRDAARGLAPLDLAVAMLATVLVPVLATIWGVVLRREPERLLRLFYGLEMPLFFLCVGRVFLVRELTAPLIVFSVAAAFGWGAFGFDLLHPAPERRTRLDIARLAGLSVLLAIGVYFAVVLMFYALPAGVALPRALLNMVSILGRTPQIMPQALLAILLLAFASTLLVVLPVASFLLYVTAWVRAERRHIRLHGRAATAVVAIGSMGAFVLALALACGQPQRGAFAALAQTPQNDAERMARLRQSDSIRRGLLNAYLGEYRYFDSTEGARSVGELWAYAFGGPSASRWTGVQHVFNFFAAPVLYDGNTSTDRQDAERAYEDFFDQPLQKGEKDAVRRALSSTWRRDNIEAGLLNRDQEVVHLAAQEVTVQERGAVAEIELHETYENTEPGEQEVLYSFSLPEDAVVTGLWLGTAPEREKADAFVVAPRGAAQRVYRREVGRRVDPALIEQLGPRQYRLRVFPVPGADVSRAATLAMAQKRPLHLWLRVAVMERGGSWPLPELIERRNVFWDASTHRSLIQDSVRQEVGAPPAQGWLPASLTRRSPRPANAVLETQVGGQRVRIAPAAAPAPDGDGTAQGRYAVILDRSRSMETRTRRLQEELEWLRVHAAGRIDVFLPSARSRGEQAQLAPLERLDARIVFYGGQSLGGMIRQLTETTSAAYDAVLVLTDDGGYDLEDTDGPTLHLEAPLLVVHLDRLPGGYSDAVTALLQRPGSGIVHTCKEAFARLQSAGPTRVPFGLHVVELAPAAGPDDEPGPVSRLAAKALVTASTAEAPHDNALLDRLHLAARRYEVVTPFSSMIVLVNDRQRQDLAAESAAADRFHRTVESGKEGLGGFLVSGVPEPEEWALIIVGLILVGRTLLRSRLRVGPTAA